MKAQSAASHAPDPYRAGLELGAALTDITPEVVFLFTTIHYGVSAEVVDGLLDGLESDDVVVVGSSGDGYYETGGVRAMGAAALGLNSGGVVRWSVFSASGLADDPAGVTADLLGQACAGERPALLFLAADFHTDASRMETVMRSVTDVPIVGGLAADDDLMTRSVLYVGRQALGRGAAVLAAYGPLALSIHVGNDLTPTGDWGTVDDAEGTTVRRIDGLPATTFVERATGKPVLRSDRAVTCLTLEDPEYPAVRWLRSIVPDSSGTPGAVGLFGGIECGARVQVCLAQPARLVEEVGELVAGARADGFEPAAALIIGCAGRKWLMGNQIQAEVNAVREAFGEALPLAGFSSFGEMAPVSTEDGRSLNMFHNMTYVLVLIGR